MDCEPGPGEKGGSQTGPSAVDRSRRGSKQHLLVDGSGLPLARTLTGGNRNDVTQLLALLDRMPPVRGRVGRPRQRPDTVIADGGYDHDKYRRLVRDLIPLDHGAHPENLATIWHCRLTESTVVTPNPLH